MTDDRAKEIAEQLRALPGDGPIPWEIAQFLVKLYDDIQAIKASMSGLSFMSAGIQPVRKIEG